MFLFDINSIAFSLLGYSLSYLELIGTVSGIFCVWLTAKEKVICWPVGIVNIVFFFILFYQVQLYSDMLLQFFFFVMTLYGWWKWTHPKTRELENKNKELKITKLSLKQIFIIAGSSVFASILLGTLMKNIHILLPKIFPKPADMPYPDAFITIFSITANLLMTVKKIECWILWVLVDIASVFLYVAKGVNLVALEYVLFGLIAAFGFYNWRNEQKTYSLTPEAD